MAKILNAQNTHARVENGGHTTCLIMEATKANIFDIVKILVNCQGTDVNVKGDYKGNADPNCLTKNNRTTVSLAAGQGNKEILSLLLNIDKKFKHSFDWDKLINVKHKNHGTSAFHYCCQNGFLDCYNT